MLNLKDFVKLGVEQLHNKNQFLISYRDKDANKNLLAFQSYRSLIAIYDLSDGKLYLNWNKWDYSKTTLKHLKMFVNEYVFGYFFESKQQFLNTIKTNLNGKIVLFEE